MKHDWKHEQDLKEAKYQADTIINVLFDAGFIDAEKLQDAIEFGNGKIADRIYDYGDEIREHCKSAYKQAIIDEIERVEP